MSKRTYAIILVILVAGLLLSACERPASIAPVTAPTKKGEIPFPVATQPQIMKDILAATQTASALLGTPAAAATSTPAFTYSTPNAEGTIVTIPLVTSTPLAPTAIAYATATPGKPSQYTIQKGEFPYCIARRFNVSAADLLSINGLGTTSVVSVGTTLKIPQTGTWSTGPRSLKTHPAAYAVGYGDTLSSIACAFGDADPNTIRAANGLSAGAVLTQGQILQIP